MRNREREEGRERERASFVGVEEERGRSRHRGERVEMVEEAVVS